MESGDTSSATYDMVFQKVPGLTWLPWVGSNYSRVPSGHRLLVVGESHYSDKKDAGEIERHVATLMGTPKYTRAVVEEALVGKASWSTPTLRRLNSLLVPGVPNRTQLWSDVAFYNFVQRPMQSYGRPTARDFESAWPVFLAVARIIEPSLCLFIGVSASHSCCGQLARDNVVVQPPVNHEKIGRCRSRRALIQLASKQAALTFIRHCGRYFPTPQWHDYLTRTHPGIMQWLRAGGTAATSSTTS